MRNGTGRHSPEANPRVLPFRAPIGIRHARWVLIGVVARQENARITNIKSYIPIPQKQNQMPNEINKVINFFRADFSKDGNPIDLSEFLSHASSLDYSVDGRYFQLDDETLLSSIITSTCFPCKAQIGYVRKGGLPQVERNGPPEPLPLPDDAGLYEPTHFVIFEEGYIGVEYNHFGPRISRLSSYFEQKFPDYFDHAALYPIIDHNLHNKVASMGEIKLFQLKINKDIIDLSKQLDDNLSDCFAALEAISDQIEDVEIILRPKRRGSLGLDDLVRRIPSWFGNRHVVEGTSKFKIRAYDRSIGSDRTFDLLQDIMRYEVKVVKQDSRHKCVDCTSMYNAIIDAYSKLRPEILRIAEN